MVKICLLCFTLLWGLYACHGQSRLSVSDSIKAVRTYQKSVILSQLGVREASGKNDGKQINAYRASVAVWLNSMQPLPPWCASFTNWIYLNFKLRMRVKSARARAYFGAKYNSYDPNLNPQLTPKFGDAAGYFFGNKEIRHIGIVYEWNPDPKVVMCRIYEGNTSGKTLTGAVCREGDGVYLKWRNKKLVKRITPIKNLIKQ